MKYQKFFHFLQNTGKDPAALYFEDELTRLKNRRFLLDYFQHNINWDKLQRHPVSLLMIDADYLRHVNDQYGHEAGDQALVHISGLVKEVTPAHGLAVRYAGDEFIILLAGTDKNGALAVAENLLEQSHYNLFFASEADTPIPLTVSIGCATAPDDADTAKGLLHQADLAVYGAKQAGKNRHVDAAEVIPETVSYKNAIHYLDNAGIVGRKSQFEVVATALKQLGRKKSSFLVIDGAPGMGKTSFLELVQRNLEKKNIKIAHVSGVLQESYRPYYLISYIAMALMRQLSDNGQSVLDGMDEAGIARLAHIMPQLIGADDPRPEDNAAHRETIFRTFTRFFTALLDESPLVLLIDDMDYSDPASLQLLEVLFQKRPAAMLICGTATAEVSTRPQAVPLELFRNAYGKQLGIQDISLTGLTAEGIDKHIRMIFPGIEVPRRMASELAAVTEGNPLFIVAVLRKMVDDAKIFHENGKWQIRRLEKNYLPRSLEEIIRQKKELLDEESRRFIDQASAFGESVSLSMLAGFSKERSARIYDYLNEAASKGLVRSEFRELDENIRFSGKMVRQAIYKDIPEEIKEDLQARIGYYKEDLYSRSLLSSTAMIAHHFNHSADAEKKNFYQEFQSDYNERLFNPDEARAYAENSVAGAGEKDPIAGRPLSEESARHVPELLRALVVAIRNTRLYPPMSKSVGDSLDQLLSILQKIHGSDPRVSIINDKNALYINQQPLRTTSYPKVAENILDLWDQLELHHVTFIHGITSRELSGFIRTLGQTRSKSVRPGYWLDFQQKHPMPHIIAGQIRYEKILPPEDARQQAPAASAAESEPSYAAAAQDFDAFSEADLQAIQQMLGHFLGAANKLKLYPASSPVAKDAVENLYNALQRFFARHKALTIARVENTLLANGNRLDLTGFETLAGGVHNLFSDSGIESLTIMLEAGPEELSGFIAAACGAEEIQTDADFWEKELNNRSIQHILVNRGLYSIKDIAAGTTDQAAETDGPKKAPAEQTDAANLPARIRDLFLSGRLEDARSILAQLQNRYKESDQAGRKELLHLFDRILTPEDWRPNTAYLQFVLAPLLELLQTETAPELLSHMAASCCRAAQDFIGFGEYALATWIFTRLQNHPRSPEIKIPEMPASVLETLVDGLATSDRNVQQSAFQLLSSLGASAQPHLINMIKSDASLRARRLAAELLKKQGPQGSKAIKKALMNEPTPEDRARILDVIDGVSTELEKELYYALLDFTKVVRQAAGRLAERLNSPAIVEILIQVAQSEETAAAVTAVNILGRLNAISAADTLIQLLAHCRDEEFQVALCQAMGQIGDESFVLPLQNILRSRRRLFFRKARSPQVRISAAYAISRINDPRCPRIIEALANDADPRLREVARSLSPGA
ncbi:MAG: diguanylate cyclase [Desulfosalsimonadaceae bacterium]